MNFIPPYESVFDLMSILTSSKHFAKFPFCSQSLLIVFQKGWTMHSQDLAAGYDEVFHTSQWLPPLQGEIKKAARRPP